MRSEADRSRIRSVWYVLGGRKHYKGPQSNRKDLDTAAADDVLVAPADREKAEMHQVV